MAISENIPFKFTYSPGAKIANLTSTVLDRIKNGHYDANQTHIYFLAGLPDLTTMVRKGNKPHGKYEEVVFRECPEAAQERIIRTIVCATENITHNGAKVCFCPIIPSHLRTWNEHRYQRGATTKLMHRDQYDQWQKNIHQTIIGINQEIRSLNRSVNMKTPEIERPVIGSFSRGAVTKPRYKFSYKELIDGTHPTEKLAEKWAEKIIKSIIVNRTTFPLLPVLPTSLHCPLDEEKDPASPKRSWMLEKRN